MTTFIAAHTIKFDDRMVSPGETIVLEDEREIARLNALGAILPAPDYERKKATRQQRGLRSAS